MVMDSDARGPDYKGDGVSVWRNTDRNGVTYLRIVVLDSIKLRAYERDNE